MKDSNNTIHYLGTKIQSMLKRPQIYAESPSALEIQVLSLLEVAMFIFDKEENIYLEWRKFAKKEIGFRGPSAVANFIYPEQQEDWKTLCDLLDKFQYSLLRN